MVRGAWWATARGIAKNRTKLKQLSTCTIKQSLAIGLSYLGGGQSKRHCYSGDKAEVKEMLKRTFL